MKIVRGFSIEKALVERLDRLARANNKSTSAMVAEVLESALDQYETTAKLMSQPKVATAMMQAMTQPGILSAIADALKNDLSAEQIKDFEKAMGATAQQINNQHVASGQRSTRRKAKDR